MFPTQGRPNATHDWSTDTWSEAACPQEGEDYYGQDGNYLINPPSYTKLDSSGKDLPDSATSWAMVRDNVTGLIWEVKQNYDGKKNYEDPHDADNTYTWYDSNPETNGGDAGTPGDGKDTEDFIALLNQANFGGHPDWRLPTTKELQSIVDFGRSSPSINQDVFGHTLSSYYWWSSTTNASSSINAWYVYFYDGRSGNYIKSNAYYVRAVRGGQSGSLDHLVINGDGTVTDTASGLMWQQATESGKDWAYALSYCEGLSLAGYTDWRLPNKMELTSIVDYGRFEPSINTSFFLGTLSSGYWSSTTYAFSIGYAWSVSFSSGYDDGYHKSNAYYVRAVRGGQSRVLGHLIILAPVQGATWVGGETETITWDTQGIGGNVRISISRQGGKEGTFTDIIADTENDGTYTWTVTGPGSVNCVLKIEPLSDTSKGTTQGLFTIDEPSPPTATTGAATSAKSTTANLNGTVIPNGASTSYYFEYGTSTNYGSKTPESNAGAGLSAVSVSADITGLTANTVYHYRLVATNSAGKGEGDDKTFYGNAGPKAIIVAGGGDYPGNNLWTATEMNADFAFKALLYQGYSKDRIYYLSPNTSHDADGDGKVDVDGNATGANLKNAITTWALDAADLFIYMTGHGGVGNFRIGEFEVLSVADFDSWLDTAQGTIFGKVVVVLDSCRSGSFVAYLIPPSGKERGVATSAASDQEAMFASSGTLSFSYLFWAHIFNGDSFYDSYTHAKDSIALAYPDRQTPQIEANGNGTANEKEDKTLADLIKVGNEDATAGDLPSIGSVSEAQTLATGTSAQIWAKDVVDADGISRVWAVITPPGYTGSPDDPVIDLPNLDLVYNASTDQYEGTYTAFTNPGTYNIAIFAEDTQEYRSLPSQTTVTGPAAAPTATTGAAISVTSASAVLNGTVNPNGGATTHHFEYGTTTSYGTPTPTVSAGSGTSNVAVSAPISGLTSGATYHFRIVAANASGTTNGADKTFTAIQACPGCGGDDVTISNKVFDSATNCECRANKSITIGNGVTIKAGAKMIFIAPKVNLKSVFKAEPGATVRIRRE